MPWVADRNTFLLAVIFYGAGMLHLIFLWKQGFRNHDRLTVGLLATGFVFHMRAMALRGMTLQHCPVNNLYETLVFVTWTLVLAALALSLVPRLRFVAAFSCPVIFALGVFALMPGLDVPYASKPEFQNALRSAHAALSMLSYGAFGLAAVAGAMFLTQESDLKQHRPRAFFSLIPPMERLEKIMSGMSKAGFALLTGGLALCPFLIVQQQTHTQLTNDPKVIWAMTIWAFYGVLLIRHMWYGQTGRRFAWGLIAVFAFVLLTFWWVNQLSPAHKI